MQKVIAINLNGNAYQLDEVAYIALRAYLDRAEVQLKDNPDRSEIVADLEQAIAEKCNKVLGPHKTVVAAPEIEQILREMGPVDGGPATEAGGAGERGGKKGESTDARAPKRLYNIREGAMISGVCNGLAAYFNIDVTIIRIIFVILAIATKGAWLLAYAILMFAIPYANTSEERAAARGMPFNAQELIDRATKNAAGFRHDREWKRQWRRRRREWKREWRETMRREHWWDPHAQQPPGYATQVWAGLMIPLFGVVNAALFLLLAVSIVSFVNAGAVFGWPVPAGIPLWAGVLILVALYHVVASPLHAVRQASYSVYRAGYPRFAAWGGVLWLGVVLFAIWFASRHWSEVEQFLQNLPEVWRSFRGAIPPR